MLNQRRVQEYHDILHGVVCGECPMPMSGAQSLMAHASHDALAWVLGFPCGRVLDENVSTILKWANDHGFTLETHGDTGATYGS